MSLSRSPTTHHPRLRAGPPQRPALIESPEPAPTLLLPLRRRRGFRPRPRLQTAHPQRPPTRRERFTACMHEQAPRAALAGLKRTQTRRAVLQPRVVQRRRVLNQQHRRLGPAALHQRLTMRLQNVLAAHLLIVQETVRCLLLGAARENRRQRLPGMLLPRRPQPLQTPTQAPVGQVRAPEFEPRPTRIVLKRQPRKRPRRPRRRTPQRLRPAPGQTPQQHVLRLPRHRRPGRTTRRPAHTLPARRPVARRPTRRLHAGLQQHRTNPVPGLPVRRQTRRRTTQHRATPSTEPAPCPTAEIGRSRPPPRCAHHACGRPNPDARRGCPTVAAPPQSSAPPQDPPPPTTNTSTGSPAPDPDPADGPPPADVRTAAEPTP